MTPEEEAAERMRLRIYRSPPTSNAYYAFVLAVLVVGIQLLLVATWPRPERKVSDGQTPSQQAAVELSGDVSALRGELPPAAPQAVAAPAPDAVPDLPWRAYAYNQGLLVLPEDVPLEWAADFPLAVGICESRMRNVPPRTVYAGGVAYVVVGIPQLLMDSAMRRLTIDLGYTPQQVIDDPAAQLRVAYWWWVRTGSSWRTWECAK